jgi:hypothetical protein
LALQLNKRKKQNQKTFKLTQVQIKPAYNTDNMGTLFFHAFCMTMSHLPEPVLNQAPGFAQLDAIKILHPEKFLPSR